MQVQKKLNSCVHMCVYTDICVDAHTYTSHYLKPYNKENTKTDDFIGEFSNF